MERRKFVKYTGIVGLAAGLFPVQAIAAAPAKFSAVLVEFPQALTQIRHGALNLPFASGIKKEMPFDWILDVHQNIFLHNGFQRNLDQDLDIVSIALEVENGFEALQLALQKEELHLVWKESSVNIKLSDTLEQLSISDDEYIFYGSCIGANNSNDFLPLQDRQYFIQVLSGKVKYDDLVLTRENGLGVQQISTAKSFVALEEEATFLVMERVL